MTMTRRFSLVAILALSLGRPATAQNVEPLLLAEKARNIFRNRCVACHSGDKARGGFHVLDVPFGRAPNRPDGNEVLQLVEVGSMPPGTQPKLSPDEVRLLQEWNNAGNPVFAEETSDEYALRQILLDVRSGGDHSRDRYFAFNHLLGAPDVDIQKLSEALTRAVNLLSWQKEFVRPTPIDPTGTIFRVNLDALGWGATPYRNNDKSLTWANHVNLFDLILLEYPHVTIPRKSAVFDALEREYLQKAAPLRPVVFVRGDWFVSAAGRSPLYEDLLRLPLTVGDLEKKLGFPPSVTAPAVLSDSNVERFPRMLERRSTSERVYWRTFDDTVKELKVGGEVLFSLPNGLPGFFIAGADGHRFAEVPDRLLREDLTKLPQKERPLRDGFSCVRCHAAGCERFNANTPALEKLSAFIPDDNNRFAEALARLTGKQPETDALTLVNRLYSERGPGQPVGGDTIPIPPLDGLTHLEQRREKKPLKVEVLSFNAATKDKQSSFKQNEKMYLEIRNGGTANVWYEFVASDRDGKMSVLAVPTPLAGGGVVRFPPGNQTLSTGDLEGKNYCYLYFSDKAFEPGMVLTTNAAELSSNVADRFVHRFPKGAADVGSFIEIEKRTIEIETQGK